MTISLPVLESSLHEPSESMMKRTILATAWATFLLVAAFFGRQSNVHKQKEKVAVSLIAILARPETYEGKRVRVWGYMELTSQYAILYFHQEDYKEGLTKNGLWLKVSSTTTEKSQEYNRKYVLVEGTFSQDTGDLGFCSGTLSKVNLLIWNRSKAELNSLRAASPSTLRPFSP